jgi:hypothetical protein
MHKMVCKVLEKALRLIHYANLRQQASVELQVNKTYVNAFFINLKEMLGRLRLGSGDIRNMDEAGVTMVQISDRVIARRG